MEICMQNIGMIQKANVCIDGITVIAGENNSGKSTVGKVLYGMLHSVADCEKNLLREFNGKLQNICEENGQIRVVELGKTVLSLEVASDQIKRLDIQNHSFFDNLVFIDAPFVIDDYDRLIRTGFPSEWANVLDKKKIDLIDKLKNPCELDLSCKEQYAEKMNSIQQTLNQIIDGDLYTDEHGLHYQSKGKAIPACTMAAGLKMFAIIKILLENHWFHAKSLFIFDEPEIHLHPQWQMALAELFVQFNRTFNLHLLIQTHSPYFLRALQIYSQKYEVEDKTNYYFAKKIIDFTSEIHNVNDDLGAIYATLSKPFEELQEISEVYL